MTAPRKPARTGAAPQAWLLLQIGLGGYVVGRSVEKISPQITSIAGASPPGARAGAKAGVKTSAKTRVKNAAGTGHGKSG